MNDFMRDDRPQSKALVYERSPEITSLNTVNQMILPDDVHGDAPQNPRHYSEVLEDIQSMVRIVVSAKPEELQATGCQLAWGLQSTLEAQLDELMASVRADERVRAERDIALGNRTITEDDAL